MLIELYKILKIVVSYIPDGRSVVGPSLSLEVYLSSISLALTLTLIIKCTAIHKLILMLIE